MKLKDNFHSESTFAPDQFESQAYTVDITGKAFDILFDGLYANKPRSIARELLSNAFDAHVAQGNVDVPFLVTLPSSLDATFAVRDYGIAMTHDETMHLYTRVFATTKGASNDYVGSWGLGSKSPFAYTDAFTVTVWRGGEKRQYLAAKGNGGIPSLTHLYTIPSDEAQGVEVSFPVKAQDFANFRREIEYVGRAFDVKPLIPGVTFAERKPLFEGKGWKLFANTNNDSVRQGCVLYPVDLYGLDSGFNYGFGLEVDVPIGSVSVTASREALQYDDDTVAALRASFASAKEELSERLETYVESSADLFQAHQRALEMDALVGHVVDYEYHGQKLDGYIKFPRKDLKSTPQHIFGRTYKELHKETFSVHVNEVDKYVFLIDRVNNELVRKTTRIRTWVKGNVNRRIYILRDPSPQSLAALVRRLHLTPDQIVSVKSLPDVTIVRAPRSSSAQKRVSGVYDLFGQPVETRGDIADDYLYVPITGIRTTNWQLGPYYSGWRSENALTKLYEIYRAIGSDVPVYLMTPGAVKRFKPTDDQLFIELSQLWVLDHIDAALDSIGEIELVNNLRTYRRSLTDEAITEMIGQPIAAQDNSTQIINLAKEINYSYTEKERKARLTGANKSETIRNAYPLIFGVQADEDVLSYIRLKQSETEEKDAT